MAGQKNQMIAAIAAAAGLGTDTTLSTTGMAADAKAAGDEIRDLSSAIDTLNVYLFLGDYVKTIELVQGYRHSITPFLYEAPRSQIQSLVRGD